MALIKTNQIGCPSLYRENWSYFPLISRPDSNKCQTLNW